MSNTQLRNLVLALVAIVAAVGVTLFFYQRSAPGKEKDAAKKDTRASEKARDTVTLNEADAAALGIETKPVEELSWQPKLFVDGRVLANPHATLEVRAPFAGILVADENTALPGIGTPVKAQQVLAKFQARFNAIEKLDLEAKSVEAEERLKGAEKVFKINQDRFERLEMIPAGGVSRGNVDAAAIQLIEARTLKEIALSQTTLWKQALERSGDKRMIVSLRAPIGGEIAEVATQPGANVEAGQLIVRIVDFSRVLIRLDFPVANSGAAPPTDIEVSTLAQQQEKPAPWRARLRGPAPNVEVGLQKAGYLYEIVPASQGAAPNWRPGLYVQASVADREQKPLDVVAIPASALLVHKGFTCVYLKQKVAARANKNYVPFKRLEVFVIDRVADTIYLDAKGWDQYSHLPVVTRHAQALLSEEFRSDVDDD